MKRFILNELAKPVLRRFGSYLAGALTALGVAAPSVDQIETGLVALGLVAVDLVSSHWNRKGK